MIAQLGERQTEDLKVPGSIPGLGILSCLVGVVWLAETDFFRPVVGLCAVPGAYHTQLLVGPCAVSGLSFFLRRVLSGWPMCCLWVVSVSCGLCAV